MTVSYNLLIALGSFDSFCAYHNAWHCFDIYKLITVHSNWKNNDISDWMNGNCVLYIDEFNNSAEFYHDIFRIPDRDLRNETTLSSSETHSKNQNYMH